MNIEDMIAYDVLTKKYRNSDYVFLTKNIEKDTTTEYNQIANAHFHLTGSLRLKIKFNCDSTSTAARLWVGVFNPSNNLLINEAYGTASGGKETVLPITLDQPFTEYTIKAKKERSFDTITITNIQVCGEIYNTGKTHAFLTEA